MQRECSEDPGTVWSGSSGPYTDMVQGLRRHPASWANYFKIMQFFTRNWVYTPNFGLKIGILYKFTPYCVKYLNFAPAFSSFCVRAWYSLFDKTCLPKFKQNLYGRIINYKQLSWQAKDLGMADSCPSRFRYDNLIWSECFTGELFVLSILVCHAHILWLCSLV